MHIHFCREKRYHIQSLVRAQHTTSEIALLIRRYRSTIGREIQRGSGLKGCRAEQACRKTSERLSHSRNAKQQINTTLCNALSPIYSATRSLSKLSGSLQSATRRFTCASTLTKPKAAACISTLEAKSPDANGWVLDRTDVGKSPCGCPLLSAQRLSTAASTLGTGRVIP